jgi:hypothetical protein
MAELDRELREHRARAQHIAMSPSVLRALWWLISQDLLRLPRTIARRGRLRQLGVDRKTRAELARRASRMIVITRRQVVAPKAQILLHSWKKVHVPFTVLLTVFAAAHIWDAWGRAW